MRSSLTAIIILFVAAAAFGQTNDKEKIGEKRAKALHAALASDDKEVWKKFVNENYTAELIEKRGMDNIMNAWTQIHKDWGASKIVSIAFKDGLTDMNVKRNRDGALILYRLTLQNADPYKVERLAVERNNVDGEEGDEPPAGADVQIKKN